MSKHRRKGRDEKPDPVMRPVPPEEVIPSLAVAVVEPMPANRTEPPPVWVPPVHEGWAVGAARDAMRNRGILGHEAAVLNELAGTDTGNAIAKAAADRIFAALVARLRGVS